MANSVFTLEALQADHGDSLLLHYGTVEAPRLIVIDGGPKDIFAESLGPRLAAIRAARGGGVLEIRMLMVSHIDDDHIVGALDLAKMLRGFQDRGVDPPYDILTLWHNSFDDIIARMSPTSAAQLRAASFGSGKRTDGAAIAASVNQGRELRREADTLGLNMNSGFDDLIQFDAEAVRVLTMGAGLTFTVLGPRKAELDALEKKWRREVAAVLAKPPKKGSAPADLQALAAAFTDKSIHNLSSVVVLAELGGKRILLTGDARGDFILDSLREAKLLKNGKCTVDIFKVPHHGSIRNAEVSLFQAVQARHYVFSANGRDGNPDPPTFDLLFKARPTGRYHLWLTNHVNKAVNRIKIKKPSGVTLHVRPKPDPSIKVELESAITW
jgi:hypothetical protein